MEKRMTTDLLEANQRGPKKAVLEQVEEYQQEVLKERSVYLLRSKCFLIVSKFPQCPDVFFAILNVFLPSMQRFI